MRFSKYIPALSLLHLFWGSACLAQKEKIDSLERAFPGLSGTARLDCMYDLAVEYFRNRPDDSITAAYYADSLYEASRNTHYLLGISKAYILKSVKAQRSNNFSQAELMAREAIAHYAQSPQKDDIEFAYRLLVWALVRQHKIEAASPYYDRWFYWAEKNKNRDEMYNSLGVKYEDYRDIGEYDKAFEAFQEVQHLNITFKGSADTAYENYVLAELLRRLGNFPVALDHYRKVIANMDLQHENIWYRVSYPELFALNGKFDSARYYFDLIDTSTLSDHDRRFYLVSIGEFYLLQGKYSEALAPLLRGAHLQREARDMTQTIRALIDIARIYTAMQKDDQALTYARQVRDLSLLTHSKQYTQDAYHIFYQIYQRKNQVDSALFYYQDYVAQKEMVANDIVKGRFAAYKYEQEVTELEKQKRRQQQYLLQERKRRNILIVALASGLMLAFFLIRNIQLKRREEQLQHQISETTTQLEHQKKEQLLAEIQQQKSELETKVLRSQMNPHFIFNSLNSINMFILENDRLLASEYLSKFSKLVRLILQNSLEAFIPLEREIEALQLYLDLESLRFDNRFEYEITIEDDIDPAMVKVPPLLIQPFAENSIWHGLMLKEEKGHLSIAITQKNEMLVYSITDDGIGRKLASEIKSKSADGHKSMGMKITTDRLLMFQRQSETSVTVNDLVLPDGNPAGTEVRIKIPVCYD